MIRKAAKSHRLAALVTDACLLALSHHHGGLVATFDRGLGDLAAQLGVAIDVVAT
jgi:predicted nucleic acid-binding protein